MRKKTDAEIRQEFSEEAWSYLKELVKKEPSPPPFKPFIQPKETHVRDYSNPSIDSITVNIPFLETPFGGQGLGRQFPESQGESYGWSGRDNRAFISVRERFGECKMLVSYFIRCGDFVKIGQTTRVCERLTNLQTANPEPLELLLCLPCRVGFREEDLHFRFRNQRKKGEWFSYDGALLTFIREKINLRVNPMDLSLIPTSEDRRLAGCGDGE